MTGPGLTLAAGIAALSLILCPCPRRAAEGDETPIGRVQPPVPSRPAQDAFRRQVQRVIGAVTAAARENMARPAGAAASGVGRLEGDELTDYYVRRAAQAASAEADPNAPRAFLVALGYALDDTGQFSGNPLVRLMLQEVETRPDRAARFAALGSPTLRGRHDWLLHFAVSAALAGLAGPAAAEAAGLQKELTDAWDKEAGKGSGFSFADLGADYAGLQLAAFFPRDPARAQEALQLLGRGFEGRSFVPELADLEEGLLYSDFLQRYGGTADERFLDALAHLRRRVADCPGWHQLGR